ncbi:MAG: alpha/beta hydrolase [Pseudomonadales bacterium]|nr:alpha/beta hydrolase [Pseudomonadales bacterium]
MRRVILPFLLLSLLACSATPEDVTRDRQSRNTLEENPAISLKFFNVGDFQLQYAEAGDIGKPTIVFVHGTPGSWRSLGRLLTSPELQERARLVSIDRPGWGGSVLPDDKRSEPDFAAQAELITPLLRQLKQESGGKSLILVGHSYGGSISPYIAYAHPELVDGLFMASSAIDPELGKPRWYNWAASTWLVAHLIDNRLVKANDEIWGVYDALETLRPWWQSVTIPMIYMQGEEDELVDPRNLDFAEQVLPTEHTRVVRLPEQGHLVHIQQRELITSLALELLDQSIKVKTAGI